MVNRTDVDLRRVQTRHRARIARIAINAPLPLPQRGRIQRPVARPHFQKQQRRFADLKSCLIGHVETDPPHASPELLDHHAIRHAGSFEDSVHVHRHEGVDRVGLRIPCRSDVLDARDQDDVGEPGELVERPLWCAARRCRLGCEKADDRNECRGRFPSVRVTSSVGPCTSRSHFNYIVRVQRRICRAARPCSHVDRLEDR